ncbi:hypothetical protein FRC03_010116 [Tulasnella sp. 419]|nr:hypothetical protein FRC03_010116 [Tulasnella sp. 419]
MSTRHSVIGISSGAAGSRHDDSTHVEGRATPNSFTVAAAHDPFITLNSAFPLQYPVGDKQVRSLVHPLDLRDHLILLRYFHQLKENVISQPTGDTRLSGNVAWDIFLAKAVRRFEVWVDTIAADVPKDANEDHPAQWEEYEIPPLDVIMVWHTYLLNPRIYYEDGLRNHQAFILHRHHFPLHHIASKVSELPTATRIRHFQSRTLQRFHQSVKPQLDSEITIECPGCRTPVAVRWYEEDGSGYSQDGFRKRCSSCPANLTRQTLGIAKLAQDLDEIKANPDTKALAGLLLEPRTGQPDLDFVREWNSNLITKLPSLKSETDTHPLGWDFEHAVEVLKHGFVQPDENGPSYRAWMKRVMKSYNTWTSFSINLRAAANRQFKFINKIASFGWLEPSAFFTEEDDAQGESRALRRFVTQYHAFLDLMAVNLDAFLVPTLGIDLAWHTHQLFHDEYRKSTIDLLGTLVDHDDAVEGKNLAASYSNTALLWQSRYRIPYSICGCPQPPPPISLASIIRSRVISKLPLPNRKRYRTPIIARPDLLELSQTSLDESHPSEHPLLAVKDKPALMPRQSVRVDLSNNRSFGKRVRRAMAGPSIDARIDRDDKMRLKREQHRSDSASFYFGLMMEGAEGVVSYYSLGQADCMVGMGASGACQGGNHKYRPHIERPTHHSKSLT